MGNISLLLGAGFSANAGYPVGNGINNKLVALKETDFGIHSSGYVHFLRPGAADELTNGLEDLMVKKFLVAFIEFYASNYGPFNYEHYFDYFWGLESGKITDQKFDTFIENFRKTHGTIIANNQFFLKHRYAFNQIVALYIVDGNGQQWYKPAHSSKPSYPGYTGFLYCMEAWGKDGIVHTHSLNHDLFTETLGHSDWLSGGFSDGFVELGSPYYGKFTDPDGFEYTVRLPYYTGRYTGNFRLYKLHGGLDQYPFNTTDNKIIDYIKLKKGVPRWEHHKEVIGDDGEMKYITDWINYHSDFLSGTTSKILRYREPIYYDKVFRSFESNLEASDKLILIGYGCLDEEVNNLIAMHFGTGTKRPIYMVNPYPNEITDRFCENFNVKLIKKSPQEIEIGDFE